MLNELFSIGSPVVTPQRENLHDDTIENHINFVKN